MVLVDATHPDVLTRLPPEFAAGFTPGEPVLALFPILAGLGITRLGLVDPFPVDPHLPAQQHAANTALSVSTRSMTAIAGELRAIPAALAQVRAAGDLGHMPLVILSSEQPFRVACRHSGAGMDSSTISSPSHPIVCSIPSQGQRINHWCTARRMSGDHCRDLPGDRCGTDGAAAGAVVQGSHGTRCHRMALPEARTVKPRM